MGFKSIWSISNVEKLATPLSPLGLDSVRVFGPVFQGVEHSRRRPGEPDRWRPVSGRLLRLPGAAAGGAEGGF